MTFLTELERLRAAATKGPWDADKAYCSNQNKITTAIYARPSKYRVIEVVETPDKYGGECIHNEHDAPLICFLVNNSDAIAEVVRAAKSVVEHPNVGLAHPLESEALRDALAKLEGK